MRQRVVIIAWILAVAAALAGCTPDPRDSVPSPTRFAGSAPSGHQLWSAAVDATRSELPNLMKVSRRIYTGGTPEGEVAFRMLKSLGIEAIVSVDGIRPDVELAEQQDMQYVHIPVGYDGIPLPAQKSLVRLVHAFEGGIYIHCHHGQHRGPAVAAMACMAEGTANHQQALAILERAGTNPDYAGLFRDVAAYRPAPFSDALPMLVAVAEVESLPQTMANIGRVFRVVEDASSAVTSAAELTDETSLDGQDRSSADQVSPSLRQQAVLLDELLHEALRQMRIDSRAYDAQFLDWMEASTRAAAAVRSAASGDTVRALEAAVGELSRQCQQCHAAYRD